MKSKTLAFVYIAVFVTILIFTSRQLQLHEKSSNVPLSSLSLTNRPDSDQVQQRLSGASLKFKSRSRQRRTGSLLSKAVLNLNFVLKKYTF